MSHDSFSPVFSPCSFDAMTTFVRDARHMSGVTPPFLLTLPFDAMREQYAMAVRAGFLKSSLLASSRFGRWVSHLERCTLGPLARQA